MTALDPVTLEVIRNAFPAIANEMAADLQRTSYNMMIYEVRDFCTALVDAEGRLISQNVGGVSHFVADLGIIVTDGIAKLGKEGFHPDDIIITNHQAVAGQHLNNVVIYMPFFHRGELVCFPMVRAHWIDIGGMSTGFGAGPRVSDPWMEGLQLDQLKIYEQGKVNQTLHKVISDNIRYPESSLGDMRSQIAACRLAVRRLEELFDRYGRETIISALARIFAETEEKCRMVVKTIPDGVYEAESVWDDDSVVLNQPVRIHARVTVKDSDMTIDLSGCSKECKGGINSRTLAAVRVAYKSLTAPLEPVNEGSFSALNVVIPEGSVMMARFPAPMAAWGQIVPTVVDTILAALAPALPKRIAAAHHALLGGAVVFFGTHPDSGRSFVLQSVEGGGWGGTPTRDGESASVTMCQGDVRNSSTEAMELKCPVLVESRALRTDSGGAGKHRGGLGLDVVVRNLVEGKWNLPRPKRTKAPPRGIWGGGNGGGAAYFLRMPGEKDYRNVDSVMQTVPPGTSVMVRTGGGAGWGNPLERDPDLVRKDVAEGNISLEIAQGTYGVVLDGGRAVDQAQTAAQRRELEDKNRAPV